MPKTHPLYGLPDDLTVWVTIHELLDDQDVFRHVTLRIREGRERSISARVQVDRYAPEWSILTAVTHTVRSCQEHQSKLTASWLKEVLGNNINSYVEPF